MGSLQARLAELRKGRGDSKTEQKSADAAPGEFVAADGVATADAAAAAVIRKNMSGLPVSPSDPQWTHADPAHGVVEQSAAATSPSVGPGAESDIVRRSDPRDWLPSEIESTSDRAPEQQEVSAGTETAAARPQSESADGELQRAASPSLSVSESAAGVDAVTAPGDTPHTAAELASQAAVTGANEQVVGEPAQAVAEHVSTQPLVSGGHVESSQAAPQAAPRAVMETVAQAEFTRPISAGSIPAAAAGRGDGSSEVAKSPNSLLGSLVSPQVADVINGLPTECYPIAGLLLGGAAVLLFARGGRVRERLPYVVGTPAGSSSALAWPVAVASVTEQRVAASSSPGPRSLFGAMTATVGAAIVAVGATAALRAQLTDQPALFRPGVLIAAAGQVVLLLGIIVLALRNARSTTGHSASSAAPQPVVAAPAPTSTVGYPYPQAHWQVPVPIAAAASTGQIAQLKAQLACLSQQLDHLGLTGPDVRNAPPAR